MTVAAPAAAAPDLPATSTILDRARTENFPVASRLLAREHREHLMALYGFARLVDDIGDEAAGDRPALLDWLEGELRRAQSGSRPDHPLLRRLQDTVQACGLPAEPLFALVAANRHDQVVTRYATFADLLDYCALSANPVGHLVLGVFGAATPERLVLSDAVCSALQVVEHLQDVAEDAARGRIYLPQEDLARFGVAEDELQGATSSAALRDLIAFEALRAGRLLDRGAPLARMLHGRPRLAVLAFVAGGRAALDAIARAGFDVLGGPPRASGRARSAALARTLMTAGRR